MQKRREQFLLVSLLSLITALSASGEDNSGFKQLAGPPEEIAAMSPANAEASTTRSQGATLPIALERDESGLWSWTAELPIERGKARIAIFSGGKAWAVKLRDPVSREWKLLDREYAQRRSAASLIGAQGSPAEIYELENLQPGILQLAAQSEEPGGGVLLFEGDGPVRLSSRQLAFNQQAGQTITLLAHLSDERGVMPFAEGRETRGYAQITGPDGSVATEPMFDDGEHQDERANDGLYGTTFRAERAGHYRVQIVFRGNDRNERPYLRTTEHLIPIVDDDLTVTATEASAIPEGERRLRIPVKVGLRKGSGRVRAFAEIWGTKNNQPVPIAWIGGMSLLEDGQLTLHLDRRWILRADAQAPFELRNLRIEESANFITVASASRIELDIPESPTPETTAEITIDEEMRNGPRPSSLRVSANAGEPVSQAYTDGVGHKLLLVHGYCSTNVWGGVSSQFTNAAVFTDLGQNRTLDTFAQLIKSFGIGWNSYAIVAHSQGGLASLHLYQYYWSGLDNAGPGRLIQSVGSPYQGTNIAGNWAAFGQIFGAGCGENTSLTYSGAASWLAGIDSSHRAKVNYYTTSFVDDAGYDYCSLATDLLLTDPDDGVVEQVKAQLSGGVNQGHKTGWCHSANMREPAQTTDSSRNATMSANAAVGPPVMTTSAATSIGQYQAMLNGSVNPSGASTATAFEYGQTQSYGSTIGAQTRSGTTTQSISASPSLSCGTLYYFRARGINSAATRYGESRSFTTSACPQSAPSVTTNSATGVGQYGATMNGTVNPNGASTTTAFEYGQTQSYGITVSAQTRTGTTAQSISASPSLSCGTTYYYRARGTNSGGTNYGSGTSFTTLACPVNAPNVSTNNASSISQSGATLNGTVNPNGASTTTAFDYGLSTSYGSSVNAQTLSGSSSQGISAGISGLQCSTTYYYRARATNSGGTNYGSSTSFTTSNCPASAPNVTTNNASSISQSGATLNGTVNPNGASTTTAFDYGLSTSYGSSVNAQTLSGSSSQGISAGVSGLQCSTTYYYRARATNSGGTNYGSSTSFTTSNCPASAPSVTTTGASNISQTGATLNGTVNPNGASTTTAFDYGLSTSYGSSVNAQTLSGSSSQGISAGISGLQCSTTYYYRARATNSGGTTYGAPVSFQTTTCPSNSCTYSIAPLSASTPAAGGNGTVQVSGTPSGCSGSWNVSSDASWLTLTGTSSGSGQGTWQVPFSVDANPAAVRAAHLSFGGAFSGSSIFTVTQAGSSSTCTSLTSGIPAALPASSAPRFEFATYCLEITGNATVLNIEISGGTGDPDLYVRYGSAPTDIDYDCRPYLDGPNEICSFTAPQAGTWYIGIDTYSPYSGVTLKATAVTPVPVQARNLYLVTPCRVIDTRGTFGPAGGPPVEANSMRTIQVTGSCGIPASAGAVALNVTAVNPPANGYFALYPTGTTLQGTATVYYRLGRTRASSAIIPLSAGGQLNVYNSTGIGPTHFVIDVTGYFY